jgi:endonuclease V-like protein UPF0215 family
VTLPRPPKLIRAIGFDDIPWRQRKSASVGIVGAVCSGTRFEGMLYGRVRRDGFGATLSLEKMLLGSKFLPQLHLVLLDGIAFGGFNVVDLPRLAQTLQRPCVAMMRRLPRIAAMERAAHLLPRPEARIALLRKAGQIHVSGPFVFQVHGAEPDEIAAALPRLTDTGNVPEALRLAHLIGGALAYGQSGGRA